MNDAGARTAHGGERIRIEDLTSPGIKPALTLTNPVEPIPIVTNRRDL